MALWGSAQSFNAANGTPVLNGPNACPFTGPHDAPLVPTVPVWRNSYHPHITGEITGAQRGEATLPRSHSHAVDLGADHGTTQPGPGLWGGGRGWESQRCPVGGWDHMVTKMRCSGLEGSPTRCWGPHPASSRWACTPSMTGPPPTHPPGQLPGRFHGRLCFCWWALTSRFPCRLGPTAASASQPGPRADLPTPMLDSIKLWGRSWCLSGNAPHFYDQQEPDLPSLTLKLRWD